MKPATSTTTVILLLIPLLSCASPRPWMGGETDNILPDLKVLYSQPEKPEKKDQKPDRSWDGWDWFWLGTSCLATAVNIYETEQALDRDCQEMNPALEWNPTLGMVIFQGLAIVLAHFWEEGRKPLLGAKTGVNAACAYNDHHAGR